MSQPRTLSGLPLQKVPAGRFFWQMWEGLYSPHGRGDRRRVACVPTLMLQPARLPLQINKMLLLFPEQNETAATINQCVVFEMDSGADVYCI